MTTFSLKLDEKLAASLAAEARMRRTTRSELCRRAIAGLLRQSGKSKPKTFLGQVPAAYVISPLTLDISSALAKKHVDHR